MINIYYGRDNINKEAFAFHKIKDHLKAGTKEVLVIVPDQYKLVTEQEALKYMETPGLMDVEITSIRRLGNKIVNDFGIGNRRYIDKYGRHILLSDIMDELSRKDELKAYSRQIGRSAFIELVNNQISEFKRFGITPEMLSEFIKDEESGSRLLKTKLSDIILIYEAYEKRIEGCYVDTEDRTNIFLENIKRSNEVSGKEIWVWGFDWFAPKDLDVLRELMEVASEMNFLFTYAQGCGDAQLFNITGSMMTKVGELAEAAGLTYRKTQIDDEWHFKRDAAIDGLERGIFAVPAPKASEEERAAARESVTMVASASVQAEAESAAAYIMSLVRDKGLRFREIALICNDQEGRGEIIRQTFDEYGISLFVDTRRSILRHPVVGFLMSLIDIVMRGYRTEDVLSMLKTGFGPFKGEDVEELENYAISYRINGKKWKEPFTKINNNFEGEELLQAMESLRQKLCAFVQKFETMFSEERDVVSRTEALYTFLKEKEYANIREKLEDNITSLEKADKYEEAAELEQIWQKLLEVMSQLQLVMGDKKVGRERYKNLLSAGLASVEIGILPPSADRITMDTMQRSRLGSDIRALVIIGANEGLIPKSSSAQNLLSDIEKRAIATGGGSEIRIGKLSDVRVQEERLAMYRVLSQPSERLYISCSSADADGGKQSPAEIFSDISRYYNITPLSQFTGFEHDEMLRGVENPQVSLRHLAEEVLHITDFGSAESKELIEKWRQVYAWCDQNAHEEAEIVMKGIGYRHVGESLTPEIAKALYPQENGNIRISPSTFENYSRCPFRFFVQMGLSPQERRIYEMASREVGDIYHECLERLMNNLSSDGKAVNDAGSRWQTTTEDDIKKLTGDIFTEIARDYRSGLASSGPVEMFRTKQMKEIICENAWAAVKHVRLGNVKSIELEQAFSSKEGAAYPAIEIETNVGKEEKTKVSVVGKIDRIDMLEGDLIKIIDYKSGIQELSCEDVKTGWKIQLMLYLKATEKGRKTAKPAGVFYYNINPKLFGAPSGNASKTIADIKAALEKEADEFNLKYRGEYAMEGLIVNSDDAVKGIVGEPASAARSIKVLNHAKWEKVMDDSTNPPTEKYEYQGSSVLTPAEFENLQKEFDEAIKKLCDNLASGKIEARPKRQRKAKSPSAPIKSGCDYCPYNSICRFDKRLPGCREELIDI